MKKHQLVGRFLAVVALILSSQVSAQAQTATKAAAAEKFLTQKERAKGMLFFMHPTAELRSVSCIKQTEVINKATRQVKQGWFCLQMRFSWRSTVFNDNHTSDLLVFFNDQGKLDEVQAGTTTTFIKPFTASNLVMTAVKTKLLNNIKDPTMKRTVSAFVARSDSAGLLTYLLKVDQK